MPVKYLADLRSRANSQRYSSIYEDQRPKIEDIERSDGETTKPGVLKRPELDRVTPINVQLILKIQERGRWWWDRWERSPLPLNTSETPSWSEEQSKQSTVSQHIWRPETKDRGHWKIRRWDKKTWSTEKTRVRPCYTHKHQLKTSEHRRLRRQHHWIPLAFYHRTQGVRIDQFKKQRLTSRVSKTMGSQRNNTQKKGKEEASEKCEMK